MNHSENSRIPKLQNAAVVITGGTRGIGEAILRRFVEEGAQVVFSGRSHDKGKALELELGQNVAFYPADAASAAQTEALINFASQRFGRIDCLVNNAGCGGEGGPIAGMSIEGFDRSIALLLRGPFLGIKYAVLHMHGGTIINIASVASLAGGYSTHAYTAAKFGLVGLTKSVALELAERGIRVNAICPGGTATEIFARIYPDLPTEWIERTPGIVAPWLAEDTPLARSGLPVDVANAALWLASSESSFVTGHALVVDGGLTVGRSWARMLDSYDRLKDKFQIAKNETERTGSKENHLSK
jgi:NAD(P)-dependent dehydrogenase (short-subunit alcohol dehydrogenase family)